MSPTEEAEVLQCVARTVCFACAADVRDDAECCDPAAGSHLKHSILGIPGLLPIVVSYVLGVGFICLFGFGLLWFLLIFITVKCICSEQGPELIVPKQKGQARPIHLSTQFHQDVYLQQLYRHMREFHTLLSFMFLWADFRATGLVVANSNFKG